MWHNDLSAGDTRSWQNVFGIHTSKSTLRSQSKSPESSRNFEEISKAMGMGVRRYAVSIRVSGLRQRYEEMVDCTRLQMIFVGDFNVNWASRNAW
ncbi:hypothetical protein CDAR_58531 [Caerostris darwini]|uniref:Endonuclease/exonuclease/phosphatase domain-containing protein n=1 Tax=Caerostris darwini TaxID=1538125 RepID=A0AAV4U7F8_9ARAC|nr:hypothetical protein CDAR_58531 [Caerostris darwini]